MIINFAVYLAQMLFDDRSLLGSQPVANALALGADWYRAPWQFYQLLTYGFVHARNDVGHILLNMFVLWLFGRDLEHKYGARSFLGMYLTAIVAAGLGWSLVESVYDSRAAHILGASGGVSAVIVLYALNYPHRQVLFMFVIPMPMWALAAMGVVYDMFGAISRSGNVAFTAHLAGALYGLYFYKLGWNPGLWIIDWGGRLSLKSKPKLRVHRPSDEPREDPLSEQLDAILRKINEQGQDSLTARERKLLEQASRKYQKRRQ